MSRLANISARECIRALERAGFRVKRQTGSHIIMARDGQRVVVPNHNPIRVGTLRNIISRAALTVEEFLDLL